MKKLLIAATTILALMTVLTGGCGGVESPSNSPTSGQAPAPSPMLEPSQVPEQSSTPSLTPASSTQASSTGFGAIQVLVTDALPDVTIDAVHINFSGVSVHQPGGGSADNETWRDIPIGNGSFELIGLGKEGLKELLAEDGHVPSGKYTQIRVDIDQNESKGVRIDYTENVTTPDGFVEVSHKDVPATLPTGVLKFVRPFSVSDNITTIITIDFIVEESLIFTGAKSDIYHEPTQKYEPKIIFKPVVKLSVKQES